MLVVLIFQFILLKIPRHGIPSNPPGLWRLMSYKILRSFLEKFDLRITRKSGDLMAYVPQIT